MVDANIVFYIKTNNNNQENVYQCVKTDIPQIRN